MQPVTTNPFLNIAVNMSIIFFVLCFFGYVIRFIHTENWRYRRKRLWKK